MNCKKGEAAFVVGAQSPLVDLIGRVVRCVESFEEVNGVMCWRLEHPARATLREKARSLDGRVYEAGSPVAIRSYPDKFLSPIRGGLTGDDASAETPTDLAHPKRRLEHRR